MIRVRLRDDTLAPGDALRGRCVALAFDFSRRRSDSANSTMRSSKGQGFVFIGEPCA